MVVFLASKLLAQADFYAESNFLYTVVRGILNDYEDQERNVLL